MLNRILYGIRLNPLLFLVSAVALAAAGANLLSFARNADRIDLAESLEHGAAVEFSYLKAFDDAHQPDAASMDCGDANSRSLLTIALATLDRTDHSDDQSQVARNLARALDAAEARLKCSPLDGNAWLQWSRLELRAAGPVPLVTEAVRNSQLFAPSESWVVAPRLDIEAKLIRVAPELELQYTADLRQYIEFEGVGAVAAAYVAHDADVRNHMRPLIAALPESRRKAIAAEVDRLGVDFSKS